MVRVDYTMVLLMLIRYYLIFKILPFNMILLLFIILLVYQMGRVTLKFTPWIVYPSIPNIDELATHLHRVGIYAAVMTFVRKSTISAAIITVGYILDSNGFVKGMLYQSVQTQKAIAAILIFGTNGLIIISLLVTLTFKSNKQSHQVIVNEINHLHQSCQGECDCRDAKNRQNINRIELLQMYRQNPRLSVKNKNHQIMRQSVDTVFSRGKIMMMMHYTNISTIDFTLTINYTVAF
ncbi:MAG: MFS transporter [Sporolactobacillus sp.]|jgi:Na+/melibiose symporter-like transporter|nr:MFS transporter [Sporolactobacillus sp.]